MLRLFLGTIALVSLCLASVVAASGQGTKDAQGKDDKASRPPSPRWMPKPAL